MDEQYELSFNKEQLLFLEDVVDALHKEAVRIEKVLIGKQKGEIKTNIAKCESILDTIRSKLTEINNEEMSD